MAILAAPHSNLVYKAPSAEPVTDAVEGWTSVLLEARVPFEFVHERDMTPESMGRYALIILPMLPV